MTTTVISNNIITGSVAHTFVTAGDELIVLPNATLGSTGNSVIGGGGLNNLSVTVLGTLLSHSMVEFYGTGVTFYIGRSGTVVSTETSGPDAALFFNGRASVVNDGQIHAPRTIGVLQTDDVEFTNNGTIFAASGVFIYASSGQRFLNSGSVTSGGASNATPNIRYNNSVMVEASSSYVANFATGIFSATSSEGAGLRMHGAAGGSVLKNHGMIQSAQDFGISLSGVDAGQPIIRIHNWGTVTGGDGAFLGSVNADEVMNRGLFAGNVQMGAGNDSFDNRLGRIEGYWDGGDGNDFYMGTLDTWTTLGVRGGAGDDQLVGGINVDHLFGNADNDRLFGREGNDLLYGEAGDDVLMGEAGNDLLDGGADLDQMRGGLGDDIYYVDRAGDVIVELAGEGTDIVYLSSNYTLAANVENGTVNVSGGRTLTGNAQNNILTGNVGNDTLNGLAGNDELIGNVGNDALNGGAGADVLTGGAGNDRFIFSSVGDTAWATYDTITDLSATDIIDLSAIDANTSVAGDQAFVKVSAFTGVAGQVRLVYSSASGDTYVQGDVNGDGVGDFRIRLVGNHSTWDNFVL